MCGIDYQHHLTATGSQVYNSIKSLKKDRQCWVQCGIVKVELSIKKWIKKQDLRRTK